MRIGIGTGVTAPLCLRAGRMPGNLFGPDDAGFWLDLASPGRLSQDAAGMLAVSDIGQPVGRVLDRSSAGLHAVQPNAAARPVYARMPLGGRRNLMRQTEDFADTAWSRSSTLITPDATPAPGAVGLADLVAKLGATPDGTTPAQSLPVLPGPYTFSVYARAAAGAWLRMRLDLAFEAGGSASGWFNLATGSVGTANAGISASIADVGDGWYRCSVTRSFSEAGTTTLGLSPVADDTGFLGSGSLYLWGAQAEAGTEATAVQHVLSNADITEAGRASRFALLHDLTDDALTTTLPAGTYTVGYADDMAVTLLTGQAVSGAYTLPAPARLYGALAINRALSVSQTAYLTSWLMAQRP